MYRKVLELALRSADHLIGLGEDEAAANILQHYVDAHPPHPQVYQRLGKLRLKQGRAAEAARCFEKALALGHAKRPAPACDSIQITGQVETIDLTAEKPSQASAS